MYRKSEHATRGCATTAKSPSPYRLPSCTADVMCFCGSPHSLINSRPITAVDAMSSSSPVARLRAHPWMRP
ncbi:hypothetical protein GZL_03060 [Streptomyces sp. 769]|nr:hypothetical protein GZL_03060 [Streptomyces sp. 769]